MREMKIRYYIRPATAGGWEGELVIPLPDGQSITAKGTAPTKAEAVNTAATLAQQALSNPLLSTVLPPQAKAALDAVNALSQSPVGAAAAKAAQGVGKGVAKLFRSIF